MVPNLVTLVKPRKMANQADLADVVGRFVRALSRHGKIAEGRLQ
jgi:hypothetical protein